MVLKTEMPDVAFVKRGKVRDIYETDHHLLLVATDRISAFDVVLPDGIPGKGRVLTQISLYWFDQMRARIPNHVVSSELEDFPPVLRKYRDILEGRSMLVEKTSPLPVECVVRGYLSGSGWKEYTRTQSVCGVRLPGGLSESARLDEPIFTPTTKEEHGHDMNITYQEVVERVGTEIAAQLRETSLSIYCRARDIAEEKGIIIADTKFEFGVFKGQLMLIDELLTPDSSRFWSVRDYSPGRSQDSYDKQIVRDYLLTLDWDKTYPGPALPEEIVEKTAKRYRDILRIITGKD